MREVKPPTFGGVKPPEKDPAFEGWKYFARLIAITVALGILASLQELLTGMEPNGVIFTFLVFVISAFEHYLHKKKSKFTLPF